MTSIEFPAISAKWVIGFFGLFHTSVGSLAIGIAFVVTVAQIIAYRHRIHRYDLFAKRAQLFNICIYNIGTINAIGLVFALSGLFPQFWSQIMNQFFWPFIIEEFLFFLLATSLTFHYFFWDKLWGHKKLHIFLGSLLTPFFLLQIYIINAIGAYMVTPGFGEAEVSLFKGILGWDMQAFYNPSFAMLHLHRSVANISYAAFFMAGWCGIRLYLSKNTRKSAYYEDCGRFSFYTGFAALLSLPIIGYFYSHVLKNDASEAFWNLMLGKGDVYVGGIDTWWLKHILVAAMLGASLAYFRRLSRSKSPFSLPTVMIYAISGFYLMFYFAMGMIMTWAFFAWMVVIAVGSALLAAHMVNYQKGSGRALFLFMGIIAFLTVMLGGYNREASRPRFVKRISHYDNVYVPQERQPYLMIPVKPEDIEKLPPPPPKGPADLIRDKCARCHSLDRVRLYPKSDWDRIIKLMRVYGTKITDSEAEQIIAHLQAGEPY